jgi:hypothetical membrane protein
LVENNPVGIVEKPPEHNASIKMKSPWDKVVTNIELVLSFFLYHLGIFNEDFTFFDTSRVWVFENNFALDILLVYGYTSILFRVALTQIITWVHKNSLTLNYPENITN